MLFLRPHPAASATRSGVHRAGGERLPAWSRSFPCSGALSDRVGRKPIIFGALLVYLAVTYPLFSWLHDNPSYLNLMITQVALCSVLGAFYGPMSTALAEQFPTHVRSTGLAVAYNFAVMDFGGFAQFFRHVAHSDHWHASRAPAFYVMFGAVVGLLAALCAFGAGLPRRTLYR